MKLTRARKNSIRVNGLLLSPTGLQSGCFCLDSEATAYLADSEHTALYESIFRRDVHSRSFDELVRRSLVQFKNKGILRLVDLRALAETYPVLQAHKMAITPKMVSFRSAVTAESLCAGMTTLAQALA